MSSFTRGAPRRQDGGGSPSPTTSSTALRPAHSTVNGDADDVTLLESVAVRLQVHHRDSYRLHDHQAHTSNLRRTIQPAAASILTRATGWPISLSETEEFR